MGGALLILKTVLTVSPICNTLPKTTLSFMHFWLRCMDNHLICSSLFSDASFACLSVCGSAVLVGCVLIWPDQKHPSLLMRVGFAFKLYGLCSASYEGCKRSIYRDVDKSQQPEKVAGYSLKNILADES